MTASKNSKIILGEFFFLVRPFPLIIHFNAHIGEGVHTPQCSGTTPGLVFGSHSQGCSEVTPRDAQRSPAVGFETMWHQGSNLGLPHSKHNPLSYLPGPNSHRHHLSAICLLLGPTFYWYHLSTCRLTFSYHPCTLKNNSKNSSKFDSTS